MRQFTSLVVLFLMMILGTNCTAADGNKTHNNIYISTNSPKIGLGVLVTDLSREKKKELKSDYGALIVHVIEESQADKLGLQKNDIITEFNNEKIYDAEDLQDAIDNIEDNKKEVTFKAIHDGESKSYKTKLAPFKENFYSFSISDDDGDVIVSTGNLKTLNGGFSNGISRAFAFSSGSSADGGYLGVNTEELSDQMLKYFEVDHGILIKEVTEESPAEKAGLQAGDVITSINGRDIDNYNDLTRTINFYNPDEKIIVAFVRKGNKKSVNVTLGSKKDFTGPEDDLFDLDDIPSAAPRIAPVPHVRGLKHWGRDKFYVL